MPGGCSITIGVPECLAARGLQSQVHHFGREGDGRATFDGLRKARSRGLSAIRWGVVALVRDCRCNGDPAWLNTGG